MKNRDENVNAIRGILQLWFGLILFTLIIMTVFTINQ